MKKIILLIFTAISALFIDFGQVSFANAQQDTAIVKAKYTYSNFGGKFAVGLSSMNNDGESMQYLFSYTGGFFKNFDINQNLSIRAEALFAQKGGRTDNLNTGDTNAPVIDFKEIYTKTNISYIEIPVMLRLKGESFFAMIGPYLGVKIMDNFEHNIPKLQNLGEKPKYSMFDFGITGGMEFPLYKRTMIDVRFTYGLSSPIQEVPKYISGFYSDNMNNFTIHVGFLFHM